MNVWLRVRVGSTAVDVVPTPGAAGTVRDAHPRFAWILICEERQPQDCSIASRRSPPTPDVDPATARHTATHIPIDHTAPPQALRHHRMEDPQRAPQRRPAHHRVGAGRPPSAACRRWSSRRPGAGPVRPAPPCSRRRLHDENRVVLVASRGGDDHHPAWYINLTANPDVKVTMYGKTREMRARTASPEEKATSGPRSSPCTSPTTDTSSARAGTSPSSSASPARRHLGLSPDAPEARERLRTPRNRKRAPSPPRPPPATARPARQAGHYDAHNVAGAVERPLTTPST